MGWWRRRGRGGEKPPIILIAGGSYALLVGISMAIVLVLTGRANFENTVALLNDKAVLTTATLENGLRGQLDPVAAAVGAMQRLFRDSDLQLEEQGLLRAALASSLFSVPAAEGLFVTVPGRGVFGVVKDDDGTRKDVPWHPAGTWTPWRFEAPGLEATSGPVWGAMIVSEFGVFANVSAPLVRDGQVEAILTAVVSTEALSEMVEVFDSASGTAFILSDTGQVIAYSGGVGEPQEASLPQSVDSFGDPVLRDLLGRPTMAPFDVAREKGVEVREIDTPAGEYNAMSRTISGYGPADWVVGVYFLNSSISREVRRLVGSSVVGLLAIVVAVFLSFRIARRLTRPLANVVRQSRKVAALEFDRVEPLPESAIREVDQVVQAFNSMAAGLRSVNTYVPKTLFRKLMRLGIEEATRSREAEITIMFTDIVGFTRQSEGMSAGEAADFLNAHFAMLVEAVEMESGTVDKFMGDGMLAFWGAPDARSDHAEAAVRAASEIGKRLRAANRMPDANMTRLRIGIHTGPVIVGNIGALDRIDYTIVGDAVNVCQRLQELGREIARSEEIVILTSDSTLERLAPEIPRMHVGGHRLRGRQAEVDVWRLYPESDVADGEGAAE